MWILLSEDVREVRMFCDAFTREDSVGTSTGKLPANSGLNPKRLKAVRSMTV
jgi:hypothetical protein